ncbi:hypothetical protein ACVQ92_12170 [Staphylococcus aureus]
MNKMVFYLYLNAKTDDTEDKEELPDALISQYEKEYLGYSCFATPSR